MLSTNDKNSKYKKKDSVIFTPKETNTNTQNKSTEATKYRNQSILNIKFPAIKRDRGSAINFLINNKNERGLKAQKRRQTITFLKEFINQEVENVKKKKVVTKGMDQFNFRG